MGGTDGEAGRQSPGAALGLKSILGLVLRFALFAPICLFIWWTVMPYYGWILGSLTKPILVHVLSIPVEAVRITEGGLLNTHTTLQFVVGDAAPSIPMGHLFSNMAPYVALVLATAGLSLRRRLTILVLGMAILFATHVVYILFAFYFHDRIEMASQVPVAIGQLFITLPFLLWLVLAYWRPLTALMAAESTR